MKDLKKTNEEEKQGEWGECLNDYVKMG